MIKKICCSTFFVPPFRNIAKGDWVILMIKLKKKIYYVINVKGLMSTIQMFILR